MRLHETTHEEAMPNKALKIVLCIVGCSIVIAPAIALEVWLVRNGASLTSIAEYSLLAGVGYYVFHRQ